MLPDTTTSSVPVTAPFLDPNGIVTDGLVSYTRGGIALQDTSEGLDYQNWRAYYIAEDSSIRLSPVSDPENEITLVTDSDVQELSVAFDQNMRWTLTRISSANVLRHSWYDSAVEGYVTSEYSGIASAKVILDDVRTKTIQLGYSDNVLCYTKFSQGLFWRKQRDRFTIEYARAPDIPGGLRITNFGMNRSNRLQWRLAQRIRRS